MFATVRTRKVVLFRRFFVFTAHDIVLNLPSKTFYQFDTNRSGRRVHSDRNGGFDRTRYYNVSYWRSGIFSEKISNLTRSVVVDFFLAFQCYDAVSTFLRTTAIAPQLVRGLAQMNLNYFIFFFFTYFSRLGVIFLKKCVYSISKST